MHKGKRKLLLCYFSCCMHMVELLKPIQSYFTAYLFWVVKCGLTRFPTAESLSEASRLICKTCCWTMEGAQQWNVYVLIQVLHLNPSPAAYAVWHKSQPFKCTCAFHVSEGQTHLQFLIFIAPHLFSNKESKRLLQVMHQKTWYFYCMTNL